MLDEVGDISSCEGHLVAGAEIQMQLLDPVYFCVEHSIKSMMMTFLTCALFRCAHSLGYMPTVLNSTCKPQEKAQKTG